MFKALNKNIIYTFCAHFFVKFKKILINKIYLTKNLEKCLGKI